MNIKAMVKAARFLVLCMLGGALIFPAAGEEAYQPFYRFDLDSPDAWQEPLRNGRFLTEGAWHFDPLDPEKCADYGIDPDRLPSEKGLDSLNISGSAEFSEKQFRELAGTIRSYAGDRQVWIVDCRLESHALLNGISVSWYDDHNWGNKGLTLAEAEADEQARFGALPGSTVTVYTAANNIAENPREISVESRMTEKELAESEGFHYLRLACSDHSWPQEEAVDAFIAFVDELDRTVGPDNVWLHFHCQAGKSRTGIFMAIYDMIRNPDVSFEDIMLRHAMTGSSYFPYVNETSELKDVYALRARRIRQVYDYLHTERNSGTGILWSDWVAGK